MAGHGLAEAETRTEVCASNRHTVSKPANRALEDLSSEAVHCIAFSSVSTAYSDHKLFDA